VASSHTFQNASGNPDRNQKAARLPNAEIDGKSSEHSLGCRENFAEQRFAGNGSGNTGSDFCLQQYVSCGSSVYWDRFNINHEKSVVESTESVETQDLASLQSNKKNGSECNFGPQSKNIASIIRGFKIGVKKYAVNNNIPFKWQPRFYDHIIRDDNDLNRIRKYLTDNPLNWKNGENSLSETIP